VAGWAAPIQTPTKRNSKTQADDRAERGNFIKIRATAVYHSTFGSERKQRPPDRSDFAKRIGLVVGGWGLNFRRAIVLLGNGLGILVQVKAKPSGAPAEGSRAAPARPTSNGLFSLRWFGYPLKNGVGHWQSSER
jgi:hypothetical protein